MATAMYMRVSDVKQEDGISLEMQEDEISKYAAYKGIEDMKKYSEIKSARSVKGRLKLSELLGDVKEGRIKKIIVYKLDRLTRSLRDLMNLLYLLDEHGCQLHSTFENIDTSTPSGRMLVQVLGIVAEWESANTSERVSSSMDKFASSGVWLSSIPFGFDRNEERKLVINEMEASILREAIDIVLDGNSFAYAEWVTSEKYGLDWSYSYLSRKIREQTMIGNMRRNNKIYEDTHEGIISKEEQDKLIGLLNDKIITNRNIEHNDIFRRKVLCPNCDSITYVQINSHNNYVSVVYSYYCGKCGKQKKSAPSVSELLMLDAFENYMGNLDVGRLDVEKPKDDVTKTIEALENRLASIEKKRDRIQRAWINEMMTDVDLKKYQAEFDEEQRKAQDELNSLAAYSPITKEELREITSLFNEHFSVLDRDEKRAFVQRHVKSIRYSRKKLKGYQKRYKITVENVEFF